MTVGELYDLLAQLKPIIGDDAVVCVGWGDEEEDNVDWKAQSGKLVLS